MMDELEIGDLLELDERDFAVISSVHKDGYQYVFLVAEKPPHTVMFAKYIPDDEGGVLKTVHTRAEKLELMEMFKDAIGDTMSSGLFSGLLPSEGN